MAGLTAIPIIGDIVKKAIEFANNRWGFNKTQQEIEVLSHEIAYQSDIKDLVTKFWQFVLDYEGGADIILTKAGILGKIVWFLRVGWRLVLQWGLVIDILIQRIQYKTSFLDLKEEIVFVAGLAVMREVGKKMSNNKK